MQPDQQFALVMGVRNILINLGPIQRSPRANCSRASACYVQKKKKNREVQPLLETMMEKENFAMVEN